MTTMTYVGRSACFHKVDSTVLRAVWCRKLVIGFAFMVPDVAYNEAYISFIFTHPEWRRAGIGSFLLYHLIQVTQAFYATPVY